MAAPTALTTITTSNSNNQNQNPNIFSQTNRTATLTTTTTGTSSTHQSANVYPLSFPKGVKHVCELCQKPATKMCDKCRVTYYCDTPCQESDWFGVHEKICQALIPLRQPLKFLPSEEERNKRDKDLKNKKLQLIEFTRSLAQRYLFEGNYERAIPGAMTSLKLVVELYGLKSVDLVPSYLILGEASQGMGHYEQAQEYLSQAEWAVLKKADCPLGILSKLHRNIGMLQMYQEKYEDALRNLSNDVYYASEEYGTESYRVSGGYFLMANIFFKLNKMDLADSLYRQVIQMWHAHLRQTVAKRTEISELESILGKKDDSEMDEDSLDKYEDLASEAEAKKVLYTIYEIRKNESSPDTEEVNRIEHCLSMVHFCSKEMEKFNELANMLASKENVSAEIKEQIEKALNYLMLKEQ